MSTLMTAHRQWSSRPVDERFWGLDDLLQYVTKRTEESRELSMTCSKFTVEHTKQSDLQILGPAGNPAALTHYSFGQLCKFAGAPADYLRSIPAQLAALNLNFGIRCRGKSEAQLLLQRNGQTSLRSITTDIYSRIWDRDLIRGLQTMLGDGWMVPPARPNITDRRARPATEADCIPNQGDFGLSIRPGNMIAPAGCYASDHDMFVFMVNPSRIIDDGGKGLMRGLFITNSEVGAGSLGIHAFMVENVCGNHICWNSQSIRRIKIIHKGRAGQKFAHQLQLLTAAIESDTNADTLALVHVARQKEIASDRLGVIDTLYKNRAIGLTRKQLEAGWDAAVIHESAAKAVPSTVWGMHHGLTRYSQTLGYADERMKIDVAAGRILDLAV